VKKLPQSKDYLKKKNKKLETENIQFKVSLSDLEDQLKKTREQLTQSQESNIELKQLITNLEDDIAKGLHHTPNNNMEEIYLQPKTKSSDDASMLQIVCNQRDRFKSRIFELEAENKELHQKLGKKDREMETLKTDNVNLYEKIKYLQSYGSSQFERHKSVDLEASKIDELENKYSKLYEDSVNPFVIFNRKEKYRRYKELNAAEKVILNSGRFFLSTKASRIFLFFYSLLLHVLVFMTLYRYSHTSSPVTT